MCSELLNMFVLNLNSQTILHYQRNLKFIHQVWTFIHRILKMQLAVEVHASVQTRKEISNGILSRVQWTSLLERYICTQTVGLDFQATVGTVRRTLVSNALNKTNQTPAINWRNKKFNEYKARNWGSLSRKRRLSVNPNMRITYPTFGLIVETRNELKIQGFGSFSREMTYLLE